MNRTLKAACVISLAALPIAVPASAEDNSLRIIAVSGPLFDPFFTALKKGADDAAAALGVEYQYTTIQDPSNAQTEITRALDQAIATQPDALIVGDYFPDSMDPLIKRAAESGIKVVLSDGPSNYRDLGAIAYVGFNPSLVGTQTGEAMAKIGVKNGICINSVAGNPSLEALCNNFVKAVTDAGGTGKVITLGYQDVSNPQTTLQAIKGALEAEPSIDGIMTLGSNQAELAVQAVDEVGREPDAVKVATLGISTKVLELQQAGKIAMVLDSQPYLDGFYSIVVAYQAAKYDLVPIAPIYVGPIPLNAEQGARAMEINKNYLGIRGIN